MQSNQQSNQTYQCSYCQMYVPVTSKEVHEKKCLAKNNQQPKINLPMNMIIQNVEIPSNYNRQGDESAGLFMTNNFQNESLIKNQQNLQQKKDIQSNNFQKGNPDFRPIQQSNIIQLQKTNSDQERSSQNSLQDLQSKQQIFNNTLNLNDKKNQLFQPICTIQNQQQQQLLGQFRVGQGQQSQQGLQIKFPQVQQNGIQFPTRIQMIQSLIRNQQLNPQPPIIPTQQLNIQSSIIPTPTFINNQQFRMFSNYQSNGQNDNISDEDEEEQNKQAEQEENGLNNFDLLKVYSDEEVNQMNDYQLYQYFMHKHINDNHKDEPNIQLSRILLDQERNQNLNQCVICQDNIIDDNMQQTLNCSHKFHYDCITKWLDKNSTCPICKARV